MFHVHLNLNLGNEPVKEFAKLGDGKLLELLIKWGPIIAALFGLKIPTLPVDDDGVALKAD